MSEPPHAAGESERASHRPDTRRLPMVHPPDPALLEEERRWLADVETRGPVARALAYLGHGGPGYLQSALTLGGGSASASLLAGAAFGYELLWVAPLGMAIGVLVLAAVAHQTLSTGMRPFEAMRVHAGPFFAWGWAVGALVSSVVWHFAQYSLASAVVVDAGEALGASVSRGAAGLGVLAWALVSAQMFGTRSRLSSWFDRVLKLFVWGIVLAFGLVAVRTGLDDPGAVLRGLVSFRVPASRGEVAGVALVLTGLATAVGVNMVFLYPYTLLARGWGREHRRLARYDLVLGMFLPYVFATGLIVIAAAGKLHAGFSGTRISPVEAARTFGDLLGPVAGRLVFDLGLCGMLATTITLHMVCAGLACSEMFGWSFGSLRYRLALLLPTPGILGAFFWSEMSVWVAVPTSIVSFFLLPVAYLGFCKLQASRSYLGDDRPGGWRGRAWLGAMVVSTLLVLGFLAWYVVTQGPAFVERLTGRG